MKNWARYNALKKKNAETLKLNAESRRAEREFYVDGPLRAQDREREIRREEANFPKGGQP